MIIEKKCSLEYFQNIWEGKKKFEVRLADFKCKEGDYILLREWDSKAKKYTGRVLKKKVGYVLKTKDLNFFSPEEVEKYGFQVISLND